MPDESAFLQSLLDEVSKLLRSWKELLALLTKTEFLVFYQPGEFEYPHTHAYFVMLPESWLRDGMSRSSRDNVDGMVKTIVHELIHIFQRFNPCETHVFLTKVLGVKLSGTRSKPSESTRNSNNRSNPDVNHNLYIDESGVHISSEYKSDADNDTRDSRDHPFEMMAYDLADVLTGEVQPSSDVMRWMVHYFM
jgi:hypothetical protein